MCYLLLALIVCATLPVYASQDGSCLSDGGELPLCVSRTSSDESVLSVQRAKRKRTEENRPTSKMPRYSSIGMPDLSVPEDVFRQQAQGYLAIHQQRVMAQFPPVLARKNIEDYMHQIDRELAPIEDPILLSECPRMGVNFAKLGLTLAEIKSHLNALSMQTDITELHLTAADLDHIPGSVYSLAQLVVLNLGGNKLGCTQDFYDKADFSYLKMLRELNLDYNAIKVLPKRSFASNSLRILFLGGNLLEEVDSQLLPKQIKALGLTNNKLQSMPILIDRFQLRALDVSGNQIKQFDPKKTLPKGIQFIDATGNQIEEVVEAGLEDGSWEMGINGQICLGGNLLKGFPKELCKVDGLKYLDLSSNAIEAAPVLSRDCLPNGGEIDLRVNCSMSSGKFLKTKDVKEAQIATNELRPQEKRVKMIAARNMSTPGANELRSRWPKPAITY